MEKARRDGFSEDVRCGWFDKVKQVLTDNDILHNPMQIWNMDESGFSNESQCK